MKLLDLYISGFGKFHERSVSFEDGLNIIYGKNEAGKSTLHTFIRSMLFGMERGRGRASKNDLYSRFEPWEHKSAYGGRLRLEQDGTVYRIERNFQKEQKSLTIVNETLGREVEPTKALMDQLLCGLNETTFNNTISIGQLKSATEGGMVSELKNYIANMNTSGNMALNITKATAFLKSKRRELERQLTPEAAKTYTLLLSEIRNLEKEISAPEYENSLHTYQTMRTQVRSLLSEKQSAREALLQKIATGKQALASGQFTDEASVICYRDETLVTYHDYIFASTASQKKSRTICLVLSLIIGLLSGGAGAVLYAVYCNMIQLPFQPFDYISNPLILFGGLGGGCFLFLVLGIILFLKGKRLKKEAAMSSKILQEIFSRHMGDSSISPEAMSAFGTRMEEFIRLCQVLVRSEVSAKEQNMEIESLLERENTCEDAITRQQRTQWELEKKLEHLTNCKDQAESLRHALEENERLREELTAIDLALDTMTELSSSIRDSFGLYLNKTASELIHGITGGIYSSMSVDEDLNVFMNTRTKLVPVEQVSSGAMDQIYLALRLAAARLIQADQERMPLIFDDSFVLYDDERLRTALKWLSQAFKGQIIIFTCHQREAQLLIAHQIPYHLISM